MTQNKRGTVTFEDYQKIVPNPYQMAVVASKRAAALAFGANPLIKTRHQKPPSVALEEIRAGKITLREESQD